MKKSFSLIAAAALAVCTVATAADYDWVGGDSGKPQSDFIWGTGSHWSGGHAPDSFEANVYVESNRGLYQKYGLRMEQSKEVGSLTMNLPRVCIIASNSKTLRIAPDGRITIGPRFTEAGLRGAVFSSTSSSHRASINANGNLTLQNDGLGEAAFSHADLQSDERWQGDTTIHFAGNGRWYFRTPAYLGQNADSPHAVDVNLGKGSFNSVVSYAATKPMQVRQLLIGGGTFRIEDSQLNASAAEDGVWVTEGGRFAGAGLVRASMRIAGELDVGYLPQPARLTINGGLTFEDSARLTLRAFASNDADALLADPAGASLRLAGTLEIQSIGKLTKDTTWQLWQGFAVTGAFKQVTLRTRPFTPDRSGRLWTLDQPDGIWQLDTLNATLSFTTKHSGTATEQPH